jgi:hypothetical protein
MNKKGEEALVINTDANHQHKRLVENEEMGWSQHSKLEGAKRSVLEMDTIGIEVMRDLKKQTDQLKDIHDKNDSLIVAIDDGNNLITRMFKRENRNKILIITFGAVLVTVFIAILFTKIL